MEISTISRLCESSFHQWIDQFPSGSAVSQDAENQLFRFNMWTANSFVHSPERSSMDWRLRNTPTLHSTLLDMLESLEVSLNDGVGQDTLEVEDTIDQLFRFSRAVRRSGILRRFVRVARYTQYDDHGVNITEEFRKGVERIIELRLRDSRAGEELKRRLVETICLRQQHFAYLKDRQAQSMPQLRSQPLPPTRSALAASISVRKPSKTSDQPARRRGPKTASSAAPSAFTATTLQSDRLPDAYARSENIQNDNDKENNIMPEAVYLPEPPALSASQRECICPFCFLVYPRQVFLDAKWKSHILQDLMPYVCLLDECLGPVMLFESTKDWVSHMKTQHGSDSWTCMDPVHEETLLFQTKDQFKNHMRESHFEQFKVEELDDMAASCFQHLPRNDILRECPFCPVAMDHGHATQTELLKHVAEHLITLSQISLVGINDNVAHSGVESRLSREDSTRDGSSTGSDFLAERLELINEAETQYMDEDLPQLSCPPSTESLHWEFVLTQFSQAGSTITHDPIIQSFIEHNQQNTPVFDTQYISNERSHLTTASAQLRQSLIEAEVRVSFQGTEQAFVPVSSRKELIKMTAVLEILFELGVTDRASSTGLARVILEEANILFAILIHQSAEGSILKFIEEGIGDDDFPLIMSHDNSALETNGGRKIGSIEDWDNASIRRLESQQYCHLAPIFHYQQHYELSDGCVFPITDMSAKEDLSNVFKARIHADHRDFHAAPLSEKNWEFLEIQGLFGQQSENWFWEIRKFHESLRMNDESTHFQTLLCTFKYQGNFFLVFSWAEGDLHELWDANPNPKPTDALLSWALKQMGNIAHGSAKVPLPAPGEYHKGLGPRRIMFFQDLQAEDESEETSPIIATNLAIAYPGKDDVEHEIANQSQPSLSTYDAPDYRRDYVMSSKADVWSLGCTYLEFVSWLSLGFDAVKEFSEWRGLDDDSPEFQTDHFYTTDLGDIRPSIFEWAGRLKGNSECPKPLIAVIDFVMTEMLLLEPKDRSSAERVSNWFKELHRQTFENALQVHPTSERSLLATSRERYLIKKVLGRWNGVIRMRQEFRRQ